MTDLHAFIADAFRWWAAGGAGFGGVMVIAAIVSVRRTSLSVKESNRALLAVLTIAGFALAAILLAGSMIPFFSDGRVAGWDRESMVYEVAITFAWLLWGCFAWGICFWFARNRVKMMVSGLVWLAVCILAAWGTVGAAL